MRLLILSRYDRQGASSRLRTMQYIPALEAAGIDVDVAPFFDNRYLEELYSGRTHRTSIPKYYLRRRSRARRRPQPDVVWVEKEAFPWLPWWLERRLLPTRVPIVADYDDAVFHRYDRHPRRIVRSLLGLKIDNVMLHAGAVTAGNEYLAARASEAGARRVVTIPTVVDTEVYSIKTHGEAQDGVRVGWIGTPGTWKECVVPFLPLLERTMVEAGALLRAVGAGQSVSQAGKIEGLEWSEETEVALIRGMDIGIMPLPDTPWMRGKCGYKLIQYMACGLPVVASPVGVNSQIVEHGVNGFLAETEEEWRDALLQLTRDHELRKRMGQAGREMVEKSYSLQSQAPHVVRTIKEAAGQCGGAV